jgi:hypothetical protein
MNKNKNMKSILSSLSNNFCLRIIIGVIITIVAARTSLSSITMSSAASSSGNNASQFVGEWKLKEIRDDNDNPRKIPTSSNNGEPFILTLGEPGDDNKSLNLHIKIGNSMWASIEFLDNSGGSKIRVGNVLSTLMYPGKELMGLERLLSEYLPRMVLIEKKDTLLIMTTAGAFISNNNIEGRSARKISHAKIVFEAVEYTV